VSPEKPGQQSELEFINQLLNI